MNIFVLDQDVEKCAEYHCDKHVVKMILEYAQMLSSAVRITTELDVGYKITHKNHPCSIWARTSLSNWRWLKELARAVNEEYKFRYGKEVNHKSFDVIEALPEPDIEDIGLTEFPQTMPDYCKLDNPINSYRNFYMKEKHPFASWKKRGVPFWYTNPV